MIKANHEKCQYCGNEADEDHVAYCEKESPLISVIIPSRVGEEIKTLPSLKKQTYKNLEIIIEYDEKQEGASATRNRGAKKARGKYLFFCDNDINLFPNCLSELYLALKSDEKAKWAFCKFYISGELHNGGKKLKPPKKIGSVEWATYFHCMSTMSLIDASVEPKFDETMKRFSDWDLWLTLSEKGYEPVFCDKVLFTTEFTKHGISSKCESDIKRWREKIYRKHRVSVYRDFLYREVQLSAIVDSFYRKIPNYLHKRYKKYIKPNTPRFVIAIMRPVNSLLAHIRNKKF